MADADDKRDKELQEAVVKAQTDTMHDVLKKIRPQINSVVTSLYEEFEQKNRAQKEKMTADFNEIIRYLNNKYHKFRKVFDIYKILENCKILNLTFIYEGKNISN